MRVQKGDQELIRNQNRAVVINLLRLRGPLSRTEISDLSGLAPSVLTRLVRDLVEEGVAQEVGKSDSTGGRPPVLVALNPDYARIIGIKVERTRLLAASVDLTGEIRDRAETRFHDAPSPEDALTGIERLCEQLDTGRTLGTGVCISGFIDPESGSDLFTPILGWENAALREPLQQRLGWPIWVENDVNALALAERWYGAGRTFRHFICITVGDGIGAGFVIGGDIYRGAFGGAGELGHITIDPGGPVCRCKERGCLEVFASDGFLLQEAAALNIGNIESLIESARNGGSEARQIFARMGQYLGIGAKNVVNLLNPEAIVLGGERMDAADLFLPSFEEEVCRHSFPSEATQLRILPAELGQDGFLIGSATLVAADFFRLPAQGGGA